MTSSNIARINKIFFILFSVLFIQSCSSVKITPTLKESKKTSKRSRKSIRSKPLKIENKLYSSDPTAIASMIGVVQPELIIKERTIIASQISSALKQYKIEPQIMVAIIDTESDFKANKVSCTGDVSVAQINVDVWNKEFIRMNKPQLIKEKIKLDQEYAILKMAEILSIIKRRHGKTDPSWYARYHSSTYRYKTEYLNKLHIRLNMLATSRELGHRIAQSN